jgi:hypothetical protein
MADAIPTTWPELLQRGEANLARYEEGIGRQLKMMDDDDDAPTQLNAGARGAANVAVTGSPERAAKIVHAWMRGFRTALEVIERPAKDAVGTHGAITFAGVGACVGAPPPGGDEVAAKWLPNLLTAKDRLTEAQQYAMAIAAAYEGLDDLVPEWLGGTPLPDAPKPGETFGVAVAPVIRYLAAAARKRLGPEAVRPAWRALLQSFPFQFQADTLNWVQLMLLARLVHARIGGAPVGEVGAWLHGEVRRAG